MAARAHDVAELSIKGNSAVLNFPELSESLPRPASLSPPDIQVAAAKAAEMEHFSTPNSSSSEATTEPDELGEIIELPSLEGSFDLAESRAELALVDSVDWWLYPPRRMHDFAFGGCYTNQTAEAAAAAAAVHSSFESLIWDFNA